MSLRSARYALRVGLLLVCAVHASCGAPPDYTAEELEAAKAELRDHVRLRTFEAGLLFGEDWVARAPDDAELRALYARQLAGWRLSREIHEQADAILADDPDEPWGHYVRALAYLSEIEYEPAIEPGRRAWEALRRPEVAAAHLESIRNRGAEHLSEVLSTLDPATRLSPEILLMQAEIQSQAQYELNDPTWADSSLATYSELRERWPDHVDGYLGAAEDLFRANRAEEAISLIEQAVALAPGSVDVRQWHWWILFLSNVLPADERRDGRRGQHRRLPGFCTGVCSRPLRPCRHVSGSGRRRAREGIRSPGHRAGPPQSACDAHLRPRVQHRAQQTQ